MKKILASRFNDEQRAFFKGVKFLLEIGSGDSLNMLAGSYEAYKNRYGAIAEIEALFKPKKNSPEYFKAEQPVFDLIDRYLK